MEEKIVKKVPLMELMEILEQFYHQGIDYIDIGGRIDEAGEEVISLSFKKDYVNAEYKENFNYLSDETEEQKEDDKPLTDEDINQTIL